MKQLLLILLVCCATLAHAQQNPKRTVTSQSMVQPNTTYIKYPIIAGAKGVGYYAGCGTPDTAFKIPANGTMLAWQYLDSCSGVSWVYNPANGGSWDTAGGKGGGGTVINNYTNGVTTFTDTLTYNASGQDTIIKIYTAGKTVSSIRTQNENGSGFLSNSGTVGDTTYIYYPVAPYGTIIYIFDGTIKPLPETGLNATPVSGTQVQLTWNTVKHAHNYELQNSYDSAQWGLLALLDSNVNTYNDTGLLAGQRYYYRIRSRATDSLFQDSRFSYASALTATLATLQTPSLAAIAGIGQNTLNWNNVANETGYLLQYSLDSVVWSDAASLAANTTTYTHTGLVNSTEYYYRIKATSTNYNYNESGWGYASATTQTVITYLAAPTMVATANSPHTALISIGNVSNETGFLLEYLSDSSWTLIDTLPQNATLYEHSYLTASTIYNYRIKALGDGVNFYDSPYSYDTAKTPAEPVVQPTTLATPVVDATPNGTTGANINWGNVLHESGYQLERSLDNSVFDIIAQLDSNVVSYSDTGLLASTKYYYRVLAKGDDSLYLNSLYGLDSVTTASLTALAAPTLTATNTSSSTNALTWTNVANEKNYSIRYSLDKRSWSVIINPAANVVSYNHNGLTAGTKYYYQVRSIGDNISFTNSAWSNIDSATTAGGAVVLQTPTLTATGISTSSILLQWQDNANEVGYQLERSLDSAVWTAFTQFPANTTSYTDAGLLANTLYYYRLKAVGNGTTYLTSGYDADTAMTLSEVYVTKFGLISEPSASGLTQPVITSQTADTLAACVVRTQWVSSNNSVANFNKVISLNKEAQINVNSFPVTPLRTFVLASERAKYVAQVDTLFRRQLVGKNDTLIVIGNEEANTSYRTIDTVVGSPTNTAYTYYFNEAKPTDSIAKAVGGGQFKTANGGFTGKPMWWFAWKNLMDSGRVAEANEMAAYIFQPNERKNLATWDKSGPALMGITVMKQLLGFYKTASFDYINLHIKLPFNGTDSSHINPRVVKNLLQAYKNLTGKPVISNEVGSKSITPAISAELLQAGADNNCKYWLWYDGSSQVTEAQASGEDISWRTADGKTLNAAGVAAALKLINLTQR